jgi:hypothetical protein
MPTPISEETAVIASWVPGIVKWIAGIASALFVLAVGRFLGWLSAESKALQENTEKLIQLTAIVETAERERQEFRRELIPWMRGQDTKIDEHTKQIAHLQGAATQKEH